MSWAHYSGPAFLVWLLLAGKSFGRPAGFERPLLVAIAFAALVLPWVVRLGIALGGVSFAEQARLGLAPNVGLAPLYTASLLALLMLSLRELGAPGQTRERVTSARQASPAAG